MHLTNYSINKKNGDAYVANNDEEACQGHKWWVQSLAITKHYAHASLDRMNQEWINIIS